MKITYLGNQRLILPLQKGWEVFSHGESKEYPISMWETLKDKKDIKSLISKDLLLVGETVPKTPLVVFSNEPEEPKEEPKEELKSLKSKIEAFKKLHYKLAIKEVENEEDMELLRRLNGEEKRPAVLRALEARLKPSV